jgi:hypothetical protein
MLHASVRLRAAVIALLVVAAASLLGASWSSVSSPGATGAGSGARVVVQP